MVTKGTPESRTEWVLGQINAWYDVYVPTVNGTTIIIHKTTVLRIYCQVAGSYGSLNQSTCMALGLKLIFKISIFWPVVRKLW